MLQTFLPLFAMTFCICLFIVLMQFLWKYVDDLVGKGLEFSVICELFLYAAMTMVPLALPLAILLASLMVFGNLGERLELTAMKSAGISLHRIMLPLTVFVAFISIGAFFFQNNILPKAQVKMYTLLFSMRQKSPELEIPEGVFYDQIDGYNLFVGKKNRENGHLYNMMIYDVSKGYGTANIIVADSGKLSFNNKKDHLFLELWHGESFEDLQNTQGSSHRNLYRRESFASKEILIPFDANFTRMDDETMRNQYVGKNVSELRVAMDSINHRIDSIGDNFARDIKTNPYFGISEVQRKYHNGKLVEIPIKRTLPKKPINLDSLFSNGSTASQREMIAQAIQRASRIKEENEFKGYALSDDRMMLRRHDIELQKKFTLALACIIFFFIGAPLGSIIRKGGLAIPIVVSVLLFVVYYIIDNTGVKLAKEGVWQVWQGLWLSTVILMPLGIFLTYKAGNDSAVFNPDFYRNLLRKITGMAVIRKVEIKELVMEDVIPTIAISKLETVRNCAQDFITRHPKPQSYKKYWFNGIENSEIDNVSIPLEDAVAYLSNSRESLIINKLMDFPILRRLFFYRPAKDKRIAWGAIVLFPIGLIGYVIGRKVHKDLSNEIQNIIKISNELIAMLTNNESSQNNITDGRD